MLRKPINNAQACFTWLSCLSSQEKGQALVGKVTDRVINAAGIYEAQNTMVTYGAEAPLLGEPGVDLSVEYYAENFVNGNPLVNTATKEQGQLFYEYVQELEKLAPGVIKSCCLYLETDTASGDAAQTSCFVNMAGGLVSSLLPAQLERQGCGRLLEPVSKTLAKCGDYLGLWLLGFMKSREATPVRLSLIERSDEGDGLLKGLKALFGDKLPKDFEEKLQALQNLGIFRFMVDVDVMPDGSLGDTIGLEFTTIKMMPSEQTMLMQEEPYQKMVAMLKEWGVADERVDCLSNCIWSGLAPDKFQAPYNMYSRLSHFKLRWKGEKIVPCKVYLQLKCEPVLENLNRYFNI